MTFQFLRKSFFQENETRKFKFLFLLQFKHTIFFFSKLNFFLKQIHPPKLGGKVFHRGFACADGALPRLRLRSNAAPVKNLGQKKFFSFLGRKDSNLRVSVPKTAALPLGDVPKFTQEFTLKKEIVCCFQKVLT